MGRIIINDHVINTPLITILEKIRELTNYEYLKQIKASGNSIMVTCPFHGEHSERHASCGIDNDEDSKTYGFYHCFTCNSKGPFFKLVAECLQVTDEEAKKWLIDNYCDILAYDELNIPEITLDKPEEKTYLDENILQKYAYIHPYMYERKLKDKIIEKFKIGYDAVNDAITFPMWNENNKLVAITERNVKTKRFYIPSQLEKPVYLFNEIKNKNYPYVIVCESQIDALTAWGYGVPAVAMLGLGSKEQYEILNKTYTNWVTMFDNDDAGKGATNRFNRLIRQDCLVVNVKIPNGKKDINDLTEYEFNNLLNSYNLTWRLVDVND